MGLARELLESVKGFTAGRRVEVRRAEVGPRFFGVTPAYEGSETLLTTGVAFLGAHQRPAAERVDEVVAEARDEAASAVAEWVVRPAGADGGLIHTAVGAAALNGLLALTLMEVGTPLGNENGLDVLARETVGKRLAVVGRFPYLEEIRAKAARSWVLELEPEGEESPASSAPEILGQADVVGITGSTMANGTLEGLLRACRREAFVVLIGPSTPLSAVLFDYGVSELCGVMAEEPARVLESIMNEGSTRRIPGTRAVSLRR